MPLPYSAWRFGRWLGVGVCLGQIFPLKDRPELPLIPFGCPIGNVTCTVPWVEVPALFLATLTSTGIAQEIPWLGGHGLAQSQEEGHYQCKSGCDSVSRDMK